MKTAILILLLATLLAPALRPDKGNVVIMGDSITWLGGDNCDKPKGWTRWWKEAAQPRTARSYARSGATWSNTASTVADTEENVGHISDNNTIYNQVLRLEAALADGSQPKPTMVIIAAGTNDAWFPKYRPEALKVTADSAWRIDGEQLIGAGPSAARSIAPAFRQAMTRLKRACPEAKVVILTPLQSTEISAARLDSVGTMLEECARRAGFVAIRQDKELPVKAADERRRHNLTYDGTHTSAAGAKANGLYLARRIAELTGTE